MVLVYDGRTCMGWIYRRFYANGMAVSFEVFDADERTLGIFETEREAVDVLWRHAHGQGAA